MTMIYVSVFVQTKIVTGRGNLMPLVISIRIYRTMGYCWNDRQISIFHETELWPITCIVHECQLWLYRHVALHLQIDPAHQVISLRGSQVEAAREMATNFVYLGIQ